jgi:hypothetical protein
MDISVLKRKIAHVMLPKYVLSVTQGYVGPQSFSTLVAMSMQESKTKHMVAGMITPQIHQASNKRALDKQLCYKRAKVLEMLDDHYGRAAQDLPLQKHQGEETPR